MKQKMHNDVRYIGIQLSQYPGLTYIWVLCLKKMIVKETLSKKVP